MAKAAAQAITKFKEKQLLEQTQEQAGLQRQPQQKQLGAEKAKLAKQQQKSRPSKPRKEKRLSAPSEEQQLSSDEVGRGLLQLHMAPVLSPPALQNLARHPMAVSHGGGLVRSPPLPAQDLTPATTVSVLETSSRRLEPLQLGGSGVGPPANMITARHLSAGLQHQHVQQAQQQLIADAQQEHFSEQLPYPNLLQQQQQQQQQQQIHQLHQFAQQFVPLLKRVRCHHLRTLRCKMLVCNHLSEQLFLNRS